MRSLFLLSALAGLALVSLQPTFAKDDDKPAKSGPTAQMQKAFTLELTALAEAETMLQTISDAKSAKAVKKKLMTKFSNMRPLLGGTDAQLEELAVAQNKVSAIMWEMMKQPYFESENMQELWTVMTHHFARRAANRR